MIKPMQITAYIKGICTAKSMTHERTQPRYEMLKMTIPESNYLQITKEILRETRFTYRVQQLPAAS